MDIYSFLETNMFRFLKTWGVYMGLYPRKEPQKPMKDSGRRFILNFWGLRPFWWALAVRFRKGSYRSYLPKKIFAKMVSSTSLGFSIEFFLPKKKKNAWWGYHATICQPSDSCRPSQLCHGRFHQAYARRVAGDWTSAARWEKVDPRSSSRAPENTPGDLRSPWLLTS